MRAAALRDIELMKIHADALFTHDGLGRLLRVNEPDGAVAPRLFLGRTGAGSVLRVRADLPSVHAIEAADLIVPESARMPLAEVPQCREAILNLLARDAPVQRIWSGPAYCIDTDALPEASNVVPITRANLDQLQSFPDWQNEMDLRRQPFFAVVDGGRAIALCCSVRITAAAHAAGVATLPEARGKGWALHAVAAWARAVGAQGAIPLYSTSWDNRASQAVARKLGMRQFGVDFHVT
ncbi:MAG: GNAT family N-acetyltransferase [Proteobacteria bacterium]|nr:GNAT family N-acetyltransferase [Pseudomonadota bacterium]